MTDDIATRLVQARKAAGYSTALQAANAMGITYPTYAAHENGQRGLARTAERYAKFFGVSLDWLLRGIGTPDKVETISAPVFSVPLMGYVGAGQELHSINDGGNEYVEAPPYSDENTVAVKVKGDSMFPVFEDGSVLYYSRMLPPPDMLNRRCVVHLSDGRILVKTLRRGSAPGMYTLASFNAPDIEDVFVDWASPIDWIRPR